MVQYPSQSWLLHRIRRSASVSRLVPVVESPFFNAKSMELRVSKPQRYLAWEDLNGLFG